ncbi:hypothetical protein D9M68_227120 [compost metagenome]
MSRLREWKRKDAERCIGEILERAKNGQAQYIQDADGEFEIRFSKTPAEKQDTGKFLSRGGPLEQ